MEKMNALFKIYPHSPRATNLSIAGGAVRLLAILLLAAACFVTLGLLFEGLRPLLHMGPLGTIMYLLDEMDDEVESAFFLWCGTALCAYASCVLKSKAQLLANESSLPPKNH